MLGVASKMLSQADDIRRFRKQYDQAHTFFDQHKLSERLRDHLLYAHRMKLSKQQDENLVEVIADRVVGVSGEDDFHERLGKTVSAGGLALSRDESDSITRYFEKIIAQGVDVSYKN